MEYGILGHLEVSTYGRAIEVAGLKERALLGLLIVEAGTVVSADRMVFELWGDEPPDTALPTLRSHISHLRRALGDEHGVLTRRPGYMLDVDADNIDSFRFEALADRVRKERRDPETVLSLAREALSLWRGPVLADLEEFLFVEEEGRRLEERRLMTLESAFEAELSLGRHVEIIPEMQTMITRHPYRERFWTQLMLALYRSARAGEALEVYSQAERVLGENLGIGPSADLRSLERSIVMEEASLDLPGHQPPHNLPASWSSFIGRDKDLISLVEIIGKSRLVTLTGVGGSGKSRLAVAAAAQLLGSFADGVWQVELAAIRDPDKMAAAVSLALGEPASHADDPVVSLIEYLKRRRILLILDNCEHLLSTCAQLVTELTSRCPGLGVLVTSREPLRVPGETVWLVRPLELPEPDASAAEQEAAEAFRLFVARAQAASPGFSVTDENRAQITQVCRSLDGLPLALELAAARSAALTPGQLAERLGEGIEVLSGGSTPTRRHQTMRSAIEWSYRLLDDRLADLFRRLAVFRGGWLIEDVHYIGGERDEDTLDDVVSLVDKSLVEAMPGAQRRYRLLEPVREFALELFEETGESEVIRSRHAARYLAVAREGDRGLRGYDQVDWLKRLQADHDNLRAALDWALASRPDLALELVAACAWFWFRAGHWRDSWAWLQKALDAAGDEFGELWAKAVYTAGGLQVIRVNPVPVYPLIERALVECREVGDRFGEAWCLHLIGHAGFYHHVDGFTAADRLQALVDARHIFEELDRPWEVAWSDRYIGDALAVDGRVKEGVELQIRSISAFREMGDRWSTAYGLQNVASAMLVLASPEYGPETARSYYQRCRRISEDLGDPVWTAHALRGLATCSYLMGLDDAEPLFEEAEERLRLIGDESCLSSAIGFLGDLRRDAGDWPTAGGRYAEALRLKKKLASMPGIAQVLDRIALLAAEVGYEMEAGRLVSAVDSVVTAWGNEYPSYSRDFHAQVMAAVELDDRGENLEDVIPLALELAEAIAEGSTPTGDAMTRT